MFFSFLGEAMKMNGDPKFENPMSAPRKWYLENTGHRFVDGLFTAPPLLAMLYQMTEDEKYVDWMDACFWDVHKEIFDHDAGLFYRDARSKPRKTKNGKKVLWSRGNGWAFGGLTRILNYLPERHASYARYKALYIQMAESLARRQQADGFWRSNLDDPEQYSMKESSGTGFFCYGITWGINHGILNRDRFLPVERKAWTALASVVNEDGKVGWSQPAGGGPGKVAETDTSKFGTGIFLLAASEIHLLVKNKETEPYDVCMYGGTPGGRLCSSGFGYHSASRTQPHYQPQSSHSTWCKDWGVVKLVRRKDPDHLGPKERS